jgi:hypothetical protein
MEPDPLYVTAMFSRLPWLLSLIIAVATLFGGATALAHPCHEATPAAAAIPAPVPQQNVRIPVTSASMAEPPLSPFHGAPCHCPDGRGDCHGHCLAMTAATLAIVESPVLDFFPDRSRVAFGGAETASRWVPLTDIDPPRPSA